MNDSHEYKEDLLRVFILYKLQKTSKLNYSVKVRIVGTLRGEESSLWLGRGTKGSPGALAMVCLSRSGCEWPRCLHFAQIHWILNMCFWEGGMFYTLIQILRKESRAMSEKGQSWPKQALEWQRLGLISDPFPSSLCELGQVTSWLCASVLSSVNGGNSSTYLIRLVVGRIKWDDLGKMLKAVSDTQKVEIRV